MIMRLAVYWDNMLRFKIITDFQRRGSTGIGTLKDFINSIIRNKEQGRGRVKVSMNY